MKYLKYVAVGLILLVIVATIVLYQREAIVREIVNAVLRDRGITATELTVDALSVDQVRLAHLVLVQDDGTRYEISGLAFPPSFPSLEPATISIDKIVVVTAAGAVEPVPFAKWLQAFLDLPVNVPNTQLSVSLLSIPDYPPFRDVIWRSSDGAQDLSFAIGDIAAALSTRMLAPARHQLSVNAATGAAADALSLTLAAQRDDAGFRLDGSSTLQLDPWLPFAKAMGLLPADVVTLDAEIRGTVTTLLPDEATLPVAVTAELKPVGELLAEYRQADGATIRLRLQSADTARLALNYPALDWTAGIQQADVQFDAPRLAGVRGQITGLACRQGIRCALRLAVDHGPVHLGAIEMGGVRLAAALEVFLEQGARVAIAPGARLALNDVAIGDYSVAAITANRITGAGLAVDDDGWHGAASELELQLAELTDGDALRATLPMTLSKLRVDDGARRIDAVLALEPQAASLVWNGTSLVAPGVNGTLARRHDALVARLDVAAARKALAAKVEATHNLASGRGTLNIRGATFDFGGRKLSGWLQKWPYSWDVVAGTLEPELAITWSAGKAGISYQGTAGATARAIAGHYREIVFTGLATRLAADLDSAAAPSLSPSAVSVGVLEVGLPVTEVVADYSIDISEKSIAVPNLSMALLGGRVTADPFTFRVDAAQNQIMLYPWSVQLQFMVDLAEFENLQVSGSISGRLPVTVSGKTVTISAGRLTSDPPGGVIRYRPGGIAVAPGAGDSATGSSMELVWRALSNFQYDSLTSSVDYTAAGDLKLQLRITGVNPDMDARQPVILNLGVEDNIPQLLRSLQATRQVEDILQRRATK